MRQWSARNAGWLHASYLLVERFLSTLHPLFKRIGYSRVEKVIMPVERTVKGFLFDSQSCGQCALGSSGMSCPMNCPKSLRNGPCGGVRLDGTCEVKPDMICVWVLAWAGSRRIKNSETGIDKVQGPVDNRLQGRSAWLREIRLKRETVVD